MRVCRTPLHMRNDHACTPNTNARGKKKKKEQDKKERHRVPMISSQGHLCGASTCTPTLQHGHCYTYVFTATSAA